jgi:DNA modification methylase
MGEVDGMKNKISIQYLPIGRLRVNPNNPRLIKDAAFKRLVKSLADCPSLFDARPCICSDRTGELIILGGNMRYLAARELNYKEVPVITMRGLTEAQEKEIIIKDNGAFGEWDFDILANLWSDLPLEEWGINIPRDPALDLDDDPTTEDDFDADAEAEKIETPVTKRGDIWILGRHRLCCGDSTSEADIKKLMGGGKADMVWTDPPYGVDYTEKNDFLNKKRTGSSHRKIAGDDLRKDGLRGFLEKAFIATSKNLRPGGCVYVAHADINTSQFRNALNTAGIKISQTIVWVKNSAVLSRNDYNWRHEPILYGWKEGAGHYFCMDFSQTTVIDNQADPSTMTQDELLAEVRELRSLINETVIRENRPKVNDLHPTMKPVNLVVRMIRNSTDHTKNEIVLDPFGGSGTTLIAAEQIRRRAYLCELDERYCDVIKLRWEKFTGQQGVLE